MKFKIYPPIGIARLGDSDRHYIGSEIPGHPGFEPAGDGTERPLAEYKDSQFRIKRQAARFRIFEVPDDGSPPRPARLPSGARVEWTVRLVNKKAGVQRGSAPKREPHRPQPIANPGPVTIDPGARTIAGANTAAVPFDTGTFQGRPVPLGEIRTDRDQNLLVLGGRGNSWAADTSFQGFYTNPGWHDDVSDGPVTAVVRLANGQSAGEVLPAWVVVAPPDFAPDIQGVVTLYDILFQVGVDKFGLAAPIPPSFTRHIFPLLQRTRRLQWVNGNPQWSSISDDWAALANPSDAARPLREDNAGKVQEIQTILSDYSLTAVQNGFLEQWMAGQFQSDWQGIPQPGDTISADGLTHAALDSTVGQGFFPGIEAGIIVKDPTLYATPFDFRIDHASVLAGDLTSLMALPWQADFLACDRSWWPSQRPDDVRTSPASTATQRWERGINGYLGMVKNFSRLGFITPAKDPGGNLVFVETQRAPDQEFQS
jgi:hypothetical protein